MFDQGGLYWRKKEYYSLQAKLDIILDRMTPQEIVDAKLRMKELEQTF